MGVFLLRPDHCRWRHVRCPAQKIFCADQAIGNGKAARKLEGLRNRAGKLA
jgi:hypothetical protein